MNICCIVASTLDVLSSIDYNAMAYIGFESFGRVLFPNKWSFTNREHDYNFQVHEQSDTGTLHSTDIQLSGKRQWPSRS